MTWTKIPARYFDRSLEKSKRIQWIGIWEGRSQNPRWDARPAKWTSVRISNATGVTFHRVPLSFYDHLDLAIKYILRRLFVLLPIPRYHTRYSVGYYDFKGNWANTTFFCYDILLNSRICEPHFRTGKLERCNRILYIHLASFVVYRICGHLSIRAASNLLCHSATTSGGTFLLNIRATCSQPTSQGLVLLP